MDKVFVSMPAKPRENNNTGAIIAAALCDYLGDVFGGEKILTTNLIHSYKDPEKYLDQYLNSIKDFGNRYDILLKDVDYGDKILDIVGDMLDIGIIKSGTERILRCDCGKVELSHNGVRKKNNADHYSVVGDKVVCNCCNGECKEYYDNILYIPIEMDKITEVKVVPSFLSKCVNGKNKDMVDTRFIISKIRNTGYSICYRGNSYFIDVDFIWMNLFRFIDCDEATLICSNKQSLKIFYINYIYSIYKSVRMNFILHPYLNCVGNSLLDSSNNYKLLKKLMVLFSLSWNRENCSWNEGVYSFLSKLTEPQLQHLYDTMCNIPNDILNSKCDMSEKIEDVLKLGTNFQKKNTIKR